MLVIEQIWFPRAFQLPMGLPDRVVGKEYRREEAKVPECLSPRVDDTPRKSERKKWV
jgi:hypothetical protein